MNEQRRNNSAYLQPAFLICAAVLACAGVGMSLLTQRLGLYLRKEPLPLRRPLSAMREERLAPYKVIAKVPIENADILKSLGTADYIQWLLEDPREPADSSLRKLLLFITYYGQADRVPHVPEECYTGGGYQRLATNAISFRVGASDGAREIPGRYLLFEKTARDLAQAVPQFPVLYLFRVNGEYAGSRDEARLALNKNIFSRHSYFCKIEMVFNQSSVSPTRERATAASEKLLSVLLPLLEQEHWPDLESGVQQDGHSACVLPGNPLHELGLISLSYGVAGWHGQARLSVDLSEGSVRQKDTDKRVCRCHPRSYWDEPLMSLLRLH